MPKIEQKDLVEILMKQVADAIRPLIAEAVNQAWLAGVSAESMRVKEAVVPATFAPEWGGKADEAFDAPPPIKQRQRIATPPQPPLPPSRLRPLECGPVKVIEQAPPCEPLAKRPATSPKPEPVLQKDLPPVVAAREYSPDNKVVIDHGLGSVTFKRGSVRLSERSCRMTSALARIMPASLTRSQLIAKTWSPVPGTADAQLMGQITTANWELEKVGLRICETRDVKKPESDYVLSEIKK